MTGDTYLKAQLARIAWEDGHQDGLNGMLAIALALRNRVAAEGLNWQQIIQNVVAYREDVMGDRRITIVPDVREPNFQKLLQHIDSVFEGTMEDYLVSGACWYGYLGHLHYGERCATVGSLTFYKARH